MCGCGARFPAIAGRIPPAIAISALKDEGAKLDAVIWRGSFGRLRAKMQEGLEVDRHRQDHLLPVKSNYQIVIENVEPAGVGALMALLEERKKKARRRGPVRRGPQAARCPICRS